MDSVPEEAKVHPLERFGTEALRLVSVLDGQLRKHPWVAGHSFSIADIALYPWVRAWKWSKIDITGAPYVMEWLTRVRQRSGVKRGVAYGVPPGEGEKWSKERKDQYRRSGSKITNPASDN